MDLVFNFLIKDQWIFKSIFVIYFFIFIFKLSKIIMEKRKLSNFLLFHFSFLLISFVALIREEFISSAIGVMFGYIVIISPNKKWLENVPLLGDLAIVSNEIREQYIENWDIVKKYQDGNKILKFFGTSLDKNVRAWRKELKQIVNNRVDKILKGTVKVNIIIGLIQYIMNPRILWDLEVLSKKSTISTALFFAGIPLQIILSLFMACIAMFAFTFLQIILEGHFAMQFEDPEYARLL